MISDDRRRHEQAIQQLRELDFLVYPAPNSRSYRVAKRPENWPVLDVNWFLRGPALHVTWLTALPTRGLHLEEPTEITSWRLSNWDSMPNACLDDIACNYPTIQLAVHACIAYYFGQPMVIDGWICPLHMHPELPEDQVRRLLPQTPPLYLEWCRQREMKLAVDPEMKEFRATQDERRIALGMRPAGGPLPLGSPDSLDYVSYPYLEFMMRSQFLPIHHADDSSRTLYLRRDLQEAYLVTGYVPD